MHRRINIFAGLLIIVIYGLLLYLPYIGLREFQGEEGRRVIIAREMVERNNWIVPTVEGKVYLNKPPLFNWLLALSFKLTGQASEITARSVSVLCAILCAILISILWKGINGKGLSFVIPGLIFLSFPDVIDKAIRAEIDMTFTLFITASLLSWFYLYEIKRKPFLAWLLSLSLLGLSILTKGIISIVFFYIAIVLYLLWKRRSRELFAPGHLAGLLGGAIVFGLWFLPLTRTIDATEVFLVWLNEILVRKEPLEGGFLRHLIEFPYLYIIAYMPWIVFLLISLKEVLKEEGQFKDITRFCLLPGLILLPLLWVIPGARVRYILPLSGLLAIAIAGSIELMIIKQNFDNRNLLSRTGGWYLRLLGTLLALISVIVPFLNRKFAFQSMIPYAGAFLLLAGGIYLTVSGEIKRKVLLLFVLILIAKNVWATIYFPYHQRNMSYYREAAKG